MQFNSIWIKFIYYWEITLQINWVAKIGYKYDIVQDTDCLFFKYGYFEPRTTWSRGLVVSVSAYETRGPGSISRVGLYFQSVFFFFPF